MKKCVIPCRKDDGMKRKMRDLENRLLFGDPQHKRALKSLIKATLGLEVTDME